MFPVGRVKVIFNAVIRSTGELFCNVGPLITLPLMKIKYHPFLLFVYRIFLDIGIKVIVPAKAGVKVKFNLPFSTLFAGSSGYFVLLFESLGDIGPTFCPICGH